MQSDTDDNTAKSSESESESSDSDLDSDSDSDKDVSSSADNVFEVERVVDKEIQPDGTAMYLVKWVGYSSPRDMTWQEAADFLDGEQNASIREFERGLLQLRTQTSARIAQEPRSASQPPAADRPSKYAARTRRPPRRLSDSP